MKPEIDEIDSKIICFLQKDGRMPYTKIAEELGIVEATVRSRVQRLVRDEVIEIVAICDPVKLGFAMSGNIKLHVNTKEIDQIVKELKAFAEITYIAVMIGDSNIDIDFIVRSLPDLHRLVYEKISSIEGINKVETSIVSGYKKEVYDYGTCFNMKDSKEE